MTRLVPIVTGALLLGACTTPAGGERPPVAELEGQCNAQPGQPFIGRKASAATGAALLEATGANELRWVPPNTAVTMDYRADRLTVSYDDNYTITKVTCG